jgi:hypothetical protein
VLCQDIRALDLLEFRKVEAIISDEKSQKWDEGESRKWDCWAARYDPVADS